MVGSSLGYIVVKLDNWALETAYVRTGKVSLYTFILRLQQELVDIIQPVPPHHRVAVKGVVFPGEPRLRHVLVK